jgi:hypothetical protein
MGCRLRLKISQNLPKSPKFSQNLLKSPLSQHGKELGRRPHFPARLEPLDYFSPNLFHELAQVLAFRFGFIYFSFFEHSHSTHCFAVHNSPVNGQLRKTFGK